MARSHIKVYVRTRPTPQPYDGFICHKDGETVTLALPRDAATTGAGAAAAAAGSASAAGPNNQLDSLTFKFDGVLEAASQESVYAAAAAPAVDAALAGANAAVLCYGQTGAGKTYTMAGDARSYANRGIVPRALRHVFQEASARSDKTYRVSVSYLEIHNEALYDLLLAGGGSGGGNGAYGDGSGSGSSANDRLAITDEPLPNGLGNVRGLTHVPVATEEDALALFFAGEAARATAPHALNGASSRGHALFGVTVEMRTSADADERALVSRLSLVDLAGSERVKKTGADGPAMREAAAINRSLSFLEQVVAALARGDAHVPFRQTKLTAALRDALSGGSATAMVANLWPELRHAEECASTLRFASRVRALATDAGAREAADTALLLRRAERRVRELTAELAMRDSLSGRGHVSYEDLSESEARELRALAAAFLAGAAPVEALPADSLKRVRDTYRALKAAAGAGAAGGTAGCTAGGGAAGGTAAAAAALESARGPAPTAAVAGGAAAAARAAAAAAAAAEAEEPGQVGEPDPAAAQRGFMLGVAPAHARPALSPAAAGASTGATSSAKHGGWSDAPASARGLQAVERAASLQPQQQQQQQQRQAHSPLSLSPSPSPPPQQQQQQQQQQQPSKMVDMNTLFVNWKAGSAGGASSDGPALSAKVRQAAAELKMAKARVALATADAGAAKAAIAAAAAAGGEGFESTEEADASSGQIRSTKASLRAALERLQSERAAATAAAAALAAAKEAQLAAFHTWAGLAHGADGADGSSGDELDAAEAFEQLRAARLAEADPACGAFYAARRRAAATTAGRAAASGKRR